MRFKKGAFGVGYLLIFLTILLVAAIVAGVLLTTMGGFEQSTLLTGEQAHHEVSTKIRMVEMYGVDGSNGNISDLFLILHLVPGSERIKFSQTLVTLSLSDMSGNYEYAGTTANLTNAANGYYILVPETIVRTGSNYSRVTADYDGDGDFDNVTGGEEGADLYLNRSAGAAIRLGSCAGGVWTSNVPSNIYVENVINGVCNPGDNVTSITLVPRNEEQGVYAVEYIHTGPNHIPGNLQKGDLVKIYIKLPRDVLDDERVQMSLIHKVGTITEYDFVLPEVMSTYRAKIYP